MNTEERLEVLERELARAKRRSRWLLAAGVRPSACPFGLGSASPSGARRRPDSRPLKTLTPSGPKMGARPPRESTYYGAAAEIRL